MVDLGAILLAAISLPVNPFLCKAMMTARVSFQVTMVDRGRTMISSTTILVKLAVCYLNSNCLTVISSLVLINTLTCVNERITDMMSAGPFVAGLKCSGNCFFSCFFGTKFIFMALRDFAINCNSSDHSS